METGGLATFLEAMSSIVTAVIGWCGTVLDFITSNEFIWIPLLGFFVVGGSVGILVRVLRG